MRIPFTKLSLVIFTINIILIVFFGSWLNTKLSQPRPINIPILDETVSLTTDSSLATFHAAKPAKGLLIYIANNKDNQAEDQARKFAKLSYYVALLDAESVNQQLEADTTPCKNFAHYFKQLTQTLSAHWQLDTKLPILMIGQDMGSPEAYITLAQTKTHDYHAVLSVNFEPWLESSTKPICDLATSTDENNRVQLTAHADLVSSWYLFQDKETNEKFDAEIYTEKITNARLTSVRRDKDTSLSLATQILQWLDPRLTDQLHASAANGLPLIEVPVPADVPVHAQKLMALIITGDGGWAEIDKNLAKHLSQKGIPTVALDSLSYFWKPRTPDETRHAVESTIKLYLQKWNAERVILIGYSFGADLMPVIANQFSTQTQKRIASIALLGLGKSASFEFRLTSWLNADDNPNRIPLSPELQKLNWIQPLCIYGLKDKLTQCPTYEADGVKVIGLPGNHHFDKKYDLVVEQLLENIRQ